MGIISLPNSSSILLKVIYLGPILVFHLLANYLNMIVSEPLGEPLPESFDSTPQEWEFVRLLAQLFPEQQELVIASLHGILDANGRSRHPCFFNVDYSKKHRRRQAHHAHFRRWCFTMYVQDFSGSLRLAQQFCCRFIIPAVGTHQMIKPSSFYSSSRHRCIVSLKKEP